MVVVLVLGVLAAISVPIITAPRDRADVQGAARLLATRLRLARVQAVARGVNVGIQIEDRGGPMLRVVADGNGNGVRQAEILTGVDSRVEPDINLRDLFPRVGLGAADGHVPAADERVPTDLFSFSPLGTSSSGTVYLQAGPATQLAVRILGATGRVRVLRRHPVTGAWEEVP